MEHIDPHPEMEDMTMRTSKERNIIFISCGQPRICSGCGIFMDAFPLECDPDLAISGLSDTFYSGSLFLVHFIT
jgi:hypothetical protein